MSIWSQLFSDRRAREQWETNLVWWRLRYEAADKPTYCLNLLSRPQACGRLALYFQAGKPISQLYVGVPTDYVRLWQRMAADFHLSLQPISEMFSWPVLSPLTAVSQLPWHESFLAHLVNGIVFISQPEPKAKGRYWPQPAVNSQTAVWSLPEPPLPGLTTRLSWPEQSPPANLIANGLDSTCWPLGRTHTGISLDISGRVNIYGRQEAVAEWLVQQVTQIVSSNPTNLVVIDGAGDLVPRLKRKTAVTRLLGEQLSYIDIDGVSLTSGFNPLALVSGETEAIQVQRWQQWFQGMNVHPQGLQLLPLAQQEGVADIPSLRKWLKQVERKGRNTAVSSLNMALNRLTANRLIREWVEWPANRFDNLPEGVLFFTCQNTGWDRQQLLQAVLLGVVSLPSVRLIVHNFPWKAVPMTHLDSQERIVVSNGPLLPNSAIILTECHVHDVAALARRFLASDACLSENLELLKRGEGMGFVGDDLFYSTWNGRSRGNDDISTMSDA